MLPLLWLSKYMYDPCPKIWFNYNKLYISPWIVIDPCHRFAWLVPTQEPWSVPTYQDTLHSEVLPPAQLWEAVCHLHMLQSIWNKQKFDIIIYMPWFSLLAVPYTWLRLWWAARMAASIYTATYRGAACKLPWFATTTHFKLFHFSCFLTI